MNPKKQPLLIDVLLDRNFLEKHFEGVTGVTFHPGENIFKQGTPLTHLVIIRKGIVKVIFNYLGKSLALLPVTAGQLIGSPGFLTDNRHHFTVVAMGSVTVDFLPVENYRQLLLSEPEFALQAIRYLNRIHTKTYQRLVSLTMKSMYGRVADTLLMMADDLYHSLTFDVIFSRQDLADFSNLSKESVVRIITAFANDGLINAKGRHFEILDRKRLEQIE